MSESAALKLQNMVLELYPLLRGAMIDVSDAEGTLRTHADLLVVMAAVNRISLAAERLGKLAEDLHKAADRALITALDETGCPAFKDGAMTVGLRQNAERVDITDRQAVPPKYLTVPEPTPDRVRIRALLKQHPEGVNWARLLPGSLGLSRRAST